MTDKVDITDEGQSLTFQQILFCENVARGQKYGQAAINAGYAKGSASSSATRLLKKEKVKARIEEIKALYLATENIDNQFLMSEYIKIIRNSTGKEPLPVIRALQLCFLQP